MLQRLGVLAVLFVLAILMVPMPVSATACVPDAVNNTFTCRVDSTADTPDALPNDADCGTPVDNTCTLRAAIQTINGDAAASASLTRIINIMPATITVTSNLPTILRQVVINGATARTTISGANNMGAAAFTLLRFTGSGSTGYKVSNLILTNARGGDGAGLNFNPGAASTLVVSNTHITNSSVAADGSGDGGGLYVGSGHTVTYADGLLSGNRAARGGAVYNAGTLSFSNTIIGGTSATECAATNTANTATRSGGGIYNDGGSLTLTAQSRIRFNCAVGSSTAPVGGGGGIYNLNGNLTLTDVTIDQNKTANPAPAGNGGGIYADLQTGGSLRLTRVVVDQNNALIDSSAAGANGGGIYLSKVLSGSVASIVDSSLSLNQARNGGGLYIERGRVDISGSSIVQNGANTDDDAGSGGGIYLDQVGAGASVGVMLSTISQNSGGTPGGTGNGGGLFFAAGNTADSSLVQSTVASNTQTGIYYGGVSLTDVFPGNLANPFTSNVIGANPQGNCNVALSHNDSNNSGFNITDDASCGLTQSSDKTTTGTMPLSLPADNTGGEKTSALLAGNPAIDYSNPLYADASSLDQRGAPAVDGDENASVVRDAGAYEFGGKGVMQFDAATYTVREDSTPAVTIVKRYGNNTQANTVIFSTANGAAPAATGGAAPAAGVDYITQTNAVVNFAAMDASKTVNVTISEDNLVEGSENIALTLSAPNTGADLGPRSTATLSITDVEEGALELSDTAYSGNENGVLPDHPGTTGLIIMVNRVSGSDKVVSVQIGTADGNGTPASGRALAGTDYIAKTETLQWADGDIDPKPFIVQLVQNDDPEPPRQFRVLLSAPTGGARLGAAATQTSTFNITDGDIAVPGKLQFELDSYTVNEQAGPLRVNVKRVDGDDLAVSVVCTAQSGTAIAGAGTTADFTTTSVTLNWADDDAADKTCTVPITNDGTRESNKHFTLNLSTPTNGAALGTPVSASILLVSDEQPRFQYSPAIYSVAEAGMMVTLNVEAIDTVAGEPVTLPYTTTDGTAIAGMDYMTASGNLVWNNGESGVKTFNVMVTSDSAAEGNETFTADLAGPMGGGEIVGVASATVTIIDPPAIRFSTNSFATTDETGVLRATVQRIGSAQGAVSVQYTACPGTAAEGTDYAAAPCAMPGMISWATNDSADKFIDIAVNPDTVFEGNETIIFTLSNPSAGAVLGSPVSATGTITEDDTAPSVTLSQTGSPLAENGGVATVTATLSNASTQDVTVTLAYSGSAANPADYSRSGASILIAAGNLTGSVTLTAVQDTVFEGSETIITDIDTVTNGSEATPQTVTSTITEDDTAPSVTLSQTGSPLAEAGGAATVTATLSNASTQDVTVNLAFTGTAANPADYTSSGTSILIAAGNLTGSVTLTAVQDTVFEGSETIITDIDTVTNGSEATPQQVTATITEDDTAPSVTLSQTGSPLAEAAGVATVTATLSNASTQDVTVAMAFTGTAANPADYTRSATQIVIAAGSLSGSITLTAAQDTIFEGNETIVTDIDTVTNGSEAAPQQVTATITDDDTAPSVTLSQTGSPLAEAAGVATVTATLSNASTQDVTVALAYSGSAANPADYTRSAAQIVIAAGSLTGSITLTAAQDTIFEGDETVVTDIDAVTNGTESGTQTLTATITDDDTAPSVTLSQTGSPLAEAAGVATVTATLSNASTQDVTVNLAYSGSANNPADYSRSGASIVIAAGSLSGSITLTAAQDTIFEGSESIVTDVDTVTNGTESGTQTQTATITDDDTAPSVSLSQAGSPLAENGGVATVTATLSNASTQDVTVTLAYSGTAASPTDYTRSGTQIVIAAGSLTGSVTLTAVQDSLFEGPESIVTEIDTVTNGTESGTQTLMATLTDDDAAPSVTLSQTGSPLAEAGGAATVTATLSNASTQDVTVNLAFTGTAANPADYTSSGASILIAAGSLTGSVTLTAVQDALFEGSETIVTDIDTVTNGSEATPQTVTASITDDDTAPTVSIADASLTEGDNAATNMTFTVSLSAPSGQAVTVMAATSNNGSALAGSDYTATSNTVTIAAGQTSASFSVPVTGDLRDEANETFTVTLTAPSNATLADAVATGTITDNDATPSLSISDAIVTEGNTGTGNLTFTISLSAVSGQNVSVMAASADGTALVADGDYTATSRTVTIAAGQINATFSVPVTSDLRDESNETLTVTLTAPANATLGDATATGSITDDDDAAPVATAGKGGALPLSLLLPLAGFASWRRRRTAKTRSAANACWNLS